jgi:lipid-A-disaccharide synthase
MRVMVACGEASGDLYAGALVRELRARRPGVEVFGIGGERMQAAGARLIADYHGIAITGLTEALRVLPRFYATLRALVAEARVTRPDVFVAIDTPELNFRLMAALKPLGIPIVYYISPQLWAWRAGRMKTMKQFVDRMLVIFPFEEPLYRRAGVDATFVGHPLIDLTAASEPRDSLLRSVGFDPSAPTVALLPGSRPNEVHRILPDMAAAVPLIRNRVPGTQFLVARAPGLDDALFSPVAGGVSGAPVIVRERTDDVLNAADVVITASGTATVQTALHEKPMVVVYRLSKATYWLGKPFVLVDMYAMPNLVAGRRVVPELIQDDFTPARVADETVRFLTDGPLYQTTKSALHEVRAKLGSPGASGRAADAILAMCPKRDDESALRLTLAGTDNV